jgi:DNA-binding NtrC family response regulator
MEKQMVMMLVDDEERFLATTSKLLERMGYCVLTAAGGAQALELLSSNPVDVVVLDVKMPGMDGIDALREIKRRFPMVEVIMLTGHATVESAIDGMQSGAFDYLIKPTDIAELILNEPDQRPIHHHGQHADHQQDQAPGNGHFDKLFLGEIPSAVGDDRGRAADDKHDEGGGHRSDHGYRLWRHLHQFGHGQHDGQHQGHGG